ncbi:MAG: hypothetical protein MZV63_15600 [Marinilabiliales bacterium]|nr:hypothetical protein [Marinilabiliales bacterium]
MPLTRTVAQRNSASCAITVVPIGGFTSNVTLSTAGAPTGCTALLNGGSIVTVAYNGTATLVVNTTNMTAPVGTYTITVYGVEA